ncbi:thrombospondin type 3 repeat-containing protein [Candidatus Lokiarchaeum ossiferum]|uniref:thrombospondin type 3 repeat-containing protein n=1 Tax=Candidatus Lokiarchaeum ossiferum TaxID=2951803 RepID=UPI00352D42AA
MPNKKGNLGMGTSIIAILIAMGALLAQFYPGFDFVDRDDPVVGILDPDLDEQVFGMITIRGLIYENSNYSISIRINGTEIGTTLPFLWNSSSISDGNYTLSILVIDVAFNQGEDSINISIINDFEWDSDHDGLGDREELRLGTNPRQIDSDTDSFSDGYEVSYGSDPLNSSDRPLLYEAEFNELVENLDGNVTLIHQLISWSHGNSSILDQLILSAEKNATLVQNLFYWGQRNASLIQDLLVWSSGNASLIQHLMDWSVGNATLISNLIASSDTETIQNLQTWLEGNATLIQELSSSLDGNATLLENLVLWSNANSTLMLSLIDWCAENATLLQNVIQWTAGNASLLQDHLATPVSAGGNITRLWFEEHYGILYPDSINTLKTISELNITFTIAGNETVYLNFNSGNVVLYSSYRVQVFFMLDDVRLNNPQAYVQSSSGTPSDFITISLQHVLRGLEEGNHTITVQFISTSLFCSLDENSLMVMTFSG